MNALLSLVIYILVLGVILWLVTYEHDLPERFAVIAVVILIALLLDLATSARSACPGLR